MGMVNLKKGEDSSCQLYHVIRTECLSRTSKDPSITLFPHSGWRHHLTSSADTPKDGPTAESTCQILGQNLKTLNFITASSNRQGTA